MARPARRFCRPPTLGLGSELTYAEAKQAYEKIMADYPGTDWAVRAHFDLESLKETRRKMDERQKPNEK